MISSRALLCQQLSREHLVQLRQAKAIVNRCLFFLMILVFFPLTLTPDPSLLRQVIPGLVWIATLLTCYLSSERLFQLDYDDGVLEQWLVSGYPLSIIVSAKILIHWLLNIIPMLLFCPLVALLFKLSVYESFALMLSLIVGTPAVLFLCGLAAAFGATLQQRGVLMALIILPLTIPIMIFGSQTLTAAMQHLPISGYLALLLAISLLTTLLSPFAIAGVVRIVFD